MKLARKLIVALCIAIFAVMALQAWLRLRSQEQFFAADSTRDLRATARAIASGTEAVWRYDGEGRAQRFVKDVNLLREEIELRWLWIDEEGVRDDGVDLDQSQLATLRAGQEVTLVHETDDGPRRFLYWPLPLGDVRPAALEISESLDPEEEFIRLSQWTIVLTAVGAALLCGLLTTALGMLFVGRPMRLLSEKARRVGAGDLSGPLRLGQRDEIGELASEINAMCERLAAAQAQSARETEARIRAIEQLRHVDRLRTVGQLASGVAHELGTPLQVVSGHAGMLRAGDLTRDESTASAEVIAEQAQRMTAIIRQLLDFSRRTGRTLGDGDVAALAASTLEMLTPFADKHGVTLRLESRDPHPVAAIDQNQMQQAITNLVVNAVQASAQSDEILIEVGRAHCTPPSGIDRSAGDYVVVTVRDHGAGIAAEHVPHVFEPFFTTKDVGDGTGLGLAVAWGIVREHGGWIEVTSAPAAGTRFTIVLPPAASAAGHSEDRHVA
jgi:two-component system NtrC family sensor kinase